MFPIWNNVTQDIYYNLLGSAENVSLKRYFRYFFLLDKEPLMFKLS